MYFGYIFAILSAILWGAVYVIAEKVLDKISPIQLMFFDSIFSCIVLGAYFVLFKKSFGIDTIHSLEKQDILLLGLSFMLTLLASYCIYLAIQYLGASRATIFEIMYPFFVIVFSLIFIKDFQINLSFILGTLFMFSGAWIIMRYS